MNNKEVIDILYKKLPEYIGEKHLNIEMNRSKFWKCPTGKHTDASPSCHIVPHNPEVWKCFGCGVSSNIFGLAHFIEGLPIEGPEFWTDTVKSLCERFNIKYEPNELGPEDKDKYQRLRAYKDASSLICTYPDNKDALIYKYLKQRGWSETTAKELGVGVIESFDEYVKCMMDLGWAKYYLQSIELLNKNIFNKKNLIFVVTDEKDRPVGFAARNMHWSKPTGIEDDGPPKYINSLTSNIYKKGGILYNFSKAKAFSPPLWIVEGYGDCLKMYEKGITNCVAIGSTYMTDYENGHVDLLKKHGIMDIILIPDNDEPGIAGLERSLRIFNNHREFNVRICQLPKDTKDADEYITTKHGADKLKELTLQTPFDYKLKSYPYDADRSEICKEMVEFVSQERSSLDQYSMIKALSSRTEFPENVIEQEVKIRSGDRDFQRHMEFKDRKNDAVKAIQSCKNLQDLYYRLDINSRTVSQLVDSYNLNRPEMEEYRQRLRDLKTEFQTVTEPGFKCGKFSFLYDALDGVPKGASMIGLAGISNIGKTSFLRNLAWELVNDNEDIVVIFMSIDDPFKKIVPAFISLSTLNLDEKIGLTLNEVAKARKKIWNDQYKMKLFEDGWNTYNSLSDRLIVKDASDGTTIATLEKYIKYYKKLYPDKKVLCILDNFHKLQDFTNHKERYALMSNRVKDLSVIHNVPIIVTLELRKGANFQQRPTLYDVKESVNIEYDCDVLMIMHQELHINNKTKRVWPYCIGSEKVDMPIDEIDFAKNKESEFKDTLYFQFTTNKSSFVQVTKEYVNALDTASTSDTPSSDQEEAKMQPTDQDASDELDMF